MPDYSTDARTMNRQLTEALLARPATPEPESGYVLRVLEISGRRTGRPILTPIGLLVHGGGRYLVSPDGSRDWPNNLRAAGIARLRAGETVDEIGTAELHGREAAEIVAAYLRAADAPWAIAAFGVPETATIDHLTAEVVRMAVFRLRPITTSR